jgi:hypothetical protein
MMAVAVGDVVDLDGVPHRYLGNGIWQPVGETLAKRFDVAGEEMMPGVLAVMERYGIEVPKCD